MLPSQSRNFERSRSRRHHSNSQILLFSPSHTLSPHTNSCRFYHGTATELATAQAAAAMCGTAASTAALAALGGQPFGNMLGHAALQRAMSLPINVHRGAPFMGHPGGSPHSYDAFLGANLGSSGGAPNALAHHLSLDPAAAAAFLSTQQAGLHSWQGTPNGMSPINNASAAAAAALALASVGGSPGSAGNIASLLAVQNAQLQQQAAQHAQRGISNGELGLGSDDVKGGLNGMNDLNGMNGMNGMNGAINGMGGAMGSMGAGTSIGRDSGNQGMLSRSLNQTDISPSTVAAQLVANGMKYANGHGGSSRNVRGSVDGSGSSPMGGMGGNGTMETDQGMNGRSINGYSVHGDANTASIASLLGGVNLGSDSSHEGKTSVPNTIHVNGNGHGHGMGGLYGNGNGGGSISGSLGSIGDPSGLWGGFNGSGRSTPLSMSRRGSLDGPLNGESRSRVPSRLSVDFQADAEGDEVRSRRPSRLSLDPQGGLAGSPAIQSGSGIWDKSGFFSAPTPAAVTSSPRTSLDVPLLNGHISNNRFNSNGVSNGDGVRGCGSDPIPVMPNIKVGSVGQESGSAQRNYSLF